jgi:POT family proton-dependent oligopeptide transporter
MSHSNLPLPQTYPKGFKSIFCTQAFFNFSFYGLKSIFVLYAIHRLNVTEVHAFSLFATLMALSYATSLFGGVLADKLLSARLTLVIGGSLSAVGVGLLFAPSPDALYWAMALLSLGAGCAKPNFSTSLSLLFQDTQDPLKDMAFTSLYVAMNLGSLSGSMVCGWLSHYYGWMASFLPLIAGYLFGITLFYINTYHLKPSKVIKPLVKIGYVPVLLGTAVILLYGLFKYHDYFHGIMAVTVTASIGCFAMIFYRCTAQERKNLLGLIPYALSFAFFCALFEQAGSSLMLFFERKVDLQIMGYGIPPSALLSLNPLMVLLFGIFLPYLSKHYLAKGKALDGLTKFGIGFLCIALSFGVLVPGLHHSATLLPLGWVILSFLLQTIGELLIVPIGFATVSKLAPPRYLSMLMGLWLMAIACGHYLAGIMAKLSIAAPEKGISNTATYNHFFTNLSLMALGAATLLMLNALRKRWVF